MHIPFSALPLTYFLQMAEAGETLKDRRSLARKQYDELVAIREQNERLVKVINDLVEAVRPVIKNTDELVLKASTNSHPSTPSRDFEPEEDIAEAAKNASYHHVTLADGSIVAVHDNGDEVMILDKKTHTPPRDGDKVSMRAANEISLRGSSGLVDSLNLSYSS